jgi:hypothetical protein
MERMNGEIRDREKPTRDSKRRILQSFKDSNCSTTTSDHMRPSVEKHLQKLWGLKVEGNNKWITLIQNASHLTTVNREKPQTIS